MKKIVFYLLLSTLSLGSFAQTDSTKTPTTTAAAKLTKKQKNRQMLELSGSGKLGIQVMENVLKSYKEALPGVPASFWDSFMKAISADELVELIVPVYDKHFTEPEIDQLIAFYQSEIGQKLVEKLPLITKDATEIGGKWGQKVAEKVMNKLKASEYYKEN